MLAWLVRHWSGRHGDTLPPRAAPKVCPEARSLSLFQHSVEARLVPGAGAW